jgi:hypothetical protein
MNETELGKKIAQELNRSTRELDPATLARLKAARTEAMNRYRLRPQVVPAHALNLPARLSHLMPQNPRLRLGLGILVLVGAMVSATFWQQSTQSDTDSVDAELLSGELPLRAFTHQDFQSWLKESR